jgi:hypothetical protein
MNMSVTHFVQAPAIAARSRSVWHEIIGTVIEEPREWLRTKSPSILHGISTIYHRRCGLSLSGVTSAYSADEPLRRRAIGRMSEGYCGQHATDANDRITM